MTTDSSHPTEPAVPIEEGKIIPTVGEGEIHPLTPEFERLTQAYVQGITGVSRAMTPIHVD